jgi:hypothetical protein
LSPREKAIAAARKRNVRRPRPWGEGIAGKVFSRSAVMCEGFLARGLVVLARSRRRHHLNFTLASAAVHVPVKVGWLTLTTEQVYSGTSDSVWRHSARVALLLQNVLVLATREPKERCLSSFFLIGIKGKMRSVCDAIFPPDYYIEGPYSHFGMVLHHSCV